MIALYDLKIYENKSVKVSWEDIYYGIKNNFLIPRSASEFAVSQINAEEEKLSEIIDLAWENTEREFILDLLERFLFCTSNMNNIGEKATIKKLRICILEDLIYREKNVKILQEKVDIIYSDFGYPEDMEELVSYMPQKAGCNTDMVYGEKNSFFEKLNRFLQKSRLNGI